MSRWMHLSLLGVATATTLQKRMIADEIVTSVGARCGSGSPAGYYHAAGKAENATKYVIYFQGGGECRTKANCDKWFRKGEGDSSQWASTMETQHGNTMDGDCDMNPDFCTWSKIYVPYCTGDMHSGTRTDPSTALGGYYFAGHLQVVGLIEDLKLLPKYKTPTHALITGSSAGGIGALTHTDFFADAWPSATVKGSPECGFFYAGVTARNDFDAGSMTPVAHLGFSEEWQPHLPTACAAATGNNMSACTDAHFLYPHIKSPVFIRENQYDASKLMNCGFMPGSKDIAYLKAWGNWMRAQLDVISKNHKDGFFSASCYQHGGNFGFDTSPVVNGVHMRDALSNWYFEKGNHKLQYTFDDCGDVPCTVATGKQQCPHFTSSENVGVTAGAHYVCDLSDAAREARFGGDVLVV
jgi:hypothetical protein